MAFQMPEVKTCCGCISLKTGAKIFGFISLIGYFLLTIISVFELYYFITYEDEELGETIFMGSIEIFCQIVQMTTSVLLIMGAYQENARLVPPWLVSTLVIAVLEMFYLQASLHRVIGMTVARFTSEEWYFLTVVMVVDDIYSLLVVYSFYKSLQSPQQLV